EHCHRIPGCQLRACSKSAHQAHDEGHRRILHRLGFDRLYTTGTEGHRQVGPAFCRFLDMEKSQVMGAEDGFKKRPFAALKLKVIEINASHALTHVSSDLNDPPIPGSGEIIYQ